ncbi:MAG: carboxypeptidase regulatory-like domain-containing protein [Clostridia bacterium]|nr:carboxypeptidase regulatory-like domain-containing protein [Clostridia bacterium]
MFFRKAIGGICKHLKLVTCAALAICILAATLTLSPLSTVADTVNSVSTQDAIFVGKVSANRYAGTFIPVDIPAATGSANMYSGDTFFKLTFDCKMLSGSKPYIGVMRVASEGGYMNTYTEPSWCNNAADVSVSDGVCTAYFKVDFQDRFNSYNRGWRSFYITVGNAEHDGGGVSEKDYDASFIMSNTSLVVCDEAHNVLDGTNRLPDFSAENIDFSGIYYTRSNGCGEWDCPSGATSMKWHIDSSSYLVKHTTVPENFSVSSNYDAANFVLTPATDSLREYYTNDKYAGLYFEKLANSEDKGFGIISSDLNKRFVFLDANRQDEPDNTTVDGYVPTKNKAANVFIPLSLGQYTLTDGKPADNKKVILKVTMKATRIEGDGAPVLGRVVGKVDNTSGTPSWAWGLSTINVRGSAYYTNYNRSDNGGGVRPQCTYDPKTGEFVGWVGVETDNVNYNTLFGVSEVLTIGNAEHVYQTGTFDSTSFNSSFSISDIKVDLYDVSISGNEHTPTTLIAEDIAPGLVADNIDAEGDWYFDFKSGPKASDHVDDLIRAGQDKWHIDGEKSLISFINMEEINGYATKYSLIESGASGTISRFMTLKAGATYQYVFRSKYESAAKAKPFVEFITTAGALKADTSNYISNSGGFYNTVYTFKTPTNLTDVKNVRLGIDFPSADISGTFGGFELYEIGSDGNRTAKNLMMTVFLSENETVYPYSATAGDNIWMTEGTLGSGGTTFVVDYKDDSFYLLPSASKMLMFCGTTTTKTEGTGESKVDYPTEPVDGNSKLWVKSTITKNKKYRFSANIKYAGTGAGGEVIGFSLATTPLTAFKDITNYTKTVDPDNYFEVYEFTAPSTLAKKNNFRATFNVPNALVSGYLANVSLREIDDSGNVIGEELIENGDFATGDATGWTREGDFAYFSFVDIPENFFSKTNPNNLHAIQYRDTANFLLLQQMLQIKANTSYELGYTSLITGYNNTEPYGILYQKIFNNVSSLAEAKALDADPNRTKVPTSSWVDMSDDDRNPDLANPDVVTTKTVLNKETFGDDFDSSDPKNQAIRVTKKFTTSELLRMSTDNNLSIRFYFMSDSSGYISDFTLYELDANGNRIGNNLVLDGDFSSGVEVFDSDSPWKYANEGNIRNIELEKGFFENYSVPSTMLRSDGSVANETYGNQLFVDPKSRYYFSGNYVKTNFVGLNPEVLYRSVAANGEYVSIPFELYFDSIRYYFETQGGFLIPDDALINSEGKADIIVRLNNLDHGKGYFCNLTLTQDNFSRNLFDISKVNPNSFIEMKYDPEIFQPFEGDDGFEDFDWDTDVDVANLTTGAITGTVYNSDGDALSGVKMKLMPGNITTATDEDGVYKFDNLAPGDYSLYLIEESGNELFCCEVNVEAGMLTEVPDITYLTDEDEEDEYDDEDDEYDEDDEGTVILDGEATKQKYGQIKGYCYDSTGKLVAGVDIYANSKSHHVKTNSKGIFEFDKVPPGKYKICTILDNGSVYVLKTVKVEAGKGIIIRVMLPDTDSGLPIWLIILIIVGSMLIISLLTLLIVFLIVKKKKKMWAVTLPDLPEAVEEIAE